MKAVGVKDNRELIKKIEEIGELVRIKKEVDWDLEVGAITRRTSELKSEAVLVENIKDYPGWRYIGNHLASFSRVACALGLDPNTDRRKIGEVYLERIRKPIKPVLIADAPCQQNVIMGDDVNLFDLPAPMVHDGDGGRYLVTGALRVTKDPDSDWVNWGTYRNMVHDERHLGGLILPSGDMGRMYYGSYVPKGKNMPVAIVITPEPISYMIGMTPVGVGVSEVDLVGGVLGEPVELVKCKTIDLEVPAHAEIILEGEVLMPEYGVDEGPFGEFTGFRTAPRLARSVFKINCVTYRNDPIVGVANMGMPVDDGDAVCAVTWAAQIKKDLQDQRIPVIDVNWPPETCSLMVIVSVKVPYSGIASRIGNIIFGGAPLGAYLNTVIVVDETVDALDLGQVMHAMAAQCEPTRGINIKRNEITNPLNPCLSLEDRKWMRGNKVVHDCTYPVSWHKQKEVPPKVSFKNKVMYSEELQKKVIENWDKYGFKKR